MIFLGRTIQFFSQLSDWISGNLVQFRALGLPQGGYMGGGGLDPHSIPKGGNLLSLEGKQKVFSIFLPFKFVYLMQGLTQIFMSSCPKDHQLRGSGVPTIFSVVLTTTTL